MTAHSPLLGALECHSTKEVGMNVEECVESGQHGLFIKTGVHHNHTAYSSRDESDAFAKVVQAVRAYCEVMKIAAEDRMDKINEDVMDLLVGLTDDEEEKQ